MKNDLIVIKERKIFNKIKNFLAKIFKIFNKKTDIEEKNSMKEEEQSYNEINFKDNIKVKKIDAIENIRNEEDFIKELERNPELIENLSDERLDLLIKYYIKITEEQKIKIQNLKKAI